MFAATSLVGVKPVVRANAGRVRCRATASAAVAPAGLSGMTGFRRAGSIDTLGRGIGSKKTFNGTVDQTLGLAGRPGRGRRFVTKAMFEVRPRKTRADAPPDRSNPTSTRKHRTFGVLPSIARANPRDGSRRASRRDAEATPPSSPRYGNKKSQATHGTSSDLLHPSPASLLSNRLAPGVGEWRRRRRRRRQSRTPGSH